MAGVNEDVKANLGHEQNCWIWKENSSGSFSRAGMSRTSGQYRGEGTQNKREAARAKADPLSHGVHLRRALGGEAPRTWIGW